MGYGWSSFRVHSYLFLQAATAGAYGMHRLVLDTLVAPSTLNISIVFHAWKRGYISTRRGRHLSGRCAGVAALAPRELFASSNQQPVVAMLLAPGLKLARPASPAPPPSSTPPSSRGSLSSGRHALHEFTAVASSARASAQTPPLPPSTCRVPCPMHTWCDSNRPTAALKASGPFALASMRTRRAHGPWPLPIIPSLLRAVDQIHLPVFHSQSARLLLALISGTFVVHPTSLNLRCRIGRLCAKLS